jgi:hypothetical protein
MLSSIPIQKRLLLTSGLSWAKKIIEKKAIQIIEDFARRTIRAGSM